MKPDTIARTIVAAIALLNAVMVMIGKAPLDLDENTIYIVVSGIAVIATTIWTWWKNNSFTKEAMIADDFMHELKAGRGDEQ
jgi:SPP1 family holin